MADVDAKAAEKAKKVAAAKKKLAAYRKSKKSKTGDGSQLGDGDFSDTASEASYSVSSDVGSLVSVDDRSTPENDLLADETLRAVDNSALQETTTVYIRRLAELEEKLTGKDGAIMSLSEENARLTTELDSYKKTNGVESSGLSNGDTEDAEKLEAKIRELSAHLHQYQAAVLQRDEAIQQLSEQSRQLQEQNRQLQSPSRGASEDGLDYAAETESLKLQVSMLKEQLDQVNSSLSRQSAPSPQPILDAKNEIITLQQNLAAQEQALQLLRGSVAERDLLIDQLKSDNAEKDMSIQSLGMKISKKSETLSELSEELDLFKAKDSENVQMIKELKASQSKSPDTGSDADSIASGGYSEEEVEEKQQELRNTLDEQYGQNMMVIKESMSKQYEESQNSLRRELETIKQQVTNWEAWGQNAQIRFQQQLQQQLAALNHQLTEKHRAELQSSQQMVNGNSSVSGDDIVERLKAQHEEEMKVLVDAAEEEANNFREKINQLEEMVGRSASPSSTQNSEQLANFERQINQLNSQVESSHVQLEELSNLYKSSQDQLADVMGRDEVKDSQLAQLTKKLESLLEDNQSLQDKLNNLDKSRQVVMSERDSIKAQLDQLNSELDQSQRANSEMSGDVEGLQEKCAQLTSTNQQLVERAEIADGEVHERHQAEVGRLEEEKRALESNMAAFKEKLISLEQTVTDKDHSLLDLIKIQQERDQLHSDLDSVKADNDKLLKQVNTFGNLQTDLENVKARLEDVSNENQALQEEKLKHLQTAASSDAVRDELDTLTSENLDLKQRLADHEEVVRVAERYQTQLVEAQDEITKARIDLDAAELKYSDYDDIQLRLETVTKDLSTYRDDNVQLRREVESLKVTAEHSSQSQHDELTALQSSLDKSEATCADLQNALSEGERCSQSLREELATLQSNLSNSEAKRTELQNSLDEGERSSQSLHEELATLQSDLNNSEAKRTELQNSLDERECSSQSLHEELATLQSDLSNSEAKRTELQNTLDKGERSSQSLHEELATLQSDLNNSEAKRTELQNALNEEEHSSQPLHEELATLQSDLSNSEAKRAELQNSLGEGERSSQSLHEELATVQSDLSNSEARCAELQNALDEGEHSSQSLHEKIATLQSDLHESEVKHAEVQNTLGVLEHSCSSLRNEIATLQSNLSDSEAKHADLTAALEELRYSSQVTIDQLQSANVSLISSQEAKLLKLQQENESLNESSQTEIAQYKIELEEMKESLRCSQEQVTSKTSDLTHSYEEEVLMLQFKIKDLQAKLDDAKSAYRDDAQDDIKMAVVQALRDQQAELEVKYEGVIRDLKQQFKQDIETECRQVEISYEQKFIQQMKETTSELDKQRQKQLNELQQAYSNDSARQMQALYDQIQEKDRALATLNKELSKSQNENNRLSEETMAMEDLRNEKESLQAQLDRVQGELEDFDRMATPTVLTDQERLLRENPVLTDQVEDSIKYQSLVDENQQLQTLLEQLRESDAGKLRISIEQLRQENEALRDQVDPHSLIPDRDELTSGVTDTSKAEIEHLKTLLATSQNSAQHVAEQYKALHAQYSQMEDYYKQALTRAATPPAADENLEHLAKLTSRCEDNESRITGLLSDLTVVKQERDKLMNDLKATQEQLSGTTEAFLKLQSDNESLGNTKIQLNSMQTVISELEESLEARKLEVAQKQQAKQSAVSELEAVREALTKAKSEGDAIPRLTHEIESLHNELLEAQSKIQELSVLDTIIPTHSTPLEKGGSAPNAAVEMYDGTRYTDRELSDDVSRLRRDMDNLQTQYNADTSALRQELESEHSNLEELREEMQNSLNTSSQSADASTNIANLTEIVSSLQNTNDKLNAEKLELNKQLMEQEKLCEKLHERLGASEALSEGVQESYAKQLAAAHKQRDEILQQLEEACRVNEQVTQLVLERNSLQQRQSEVKDKLRERDDLEIELLKMKTQLESLTHSHHKMAENLAQKDQAGLELSKRNTILEAAVQQMEGKLKESEKAFLGEKQLAGVKEDEVIAANKQRQELEQRLSEERAKQRSRLTAELQQTKTASEKNAVMKIRQTRLEMEEKYNQAIAKLRMELAEDSKKKQDGLRSKHAVEVDQLETRHKKQLEEFSLSSERRIQELVEQLQDKQTSQLAAVKELTEKVKHDEIQRLQAQFEQEAEEIRSDMDVAHQQQFDEMLKTQKEQLEQEKQAVKKEMEVEIGEIKLTLERLHSEQMAHLNATLQAEKSHSLSALESQLKSQHAEEKIALEEEFQARLTQTRDEHRSAVEELNSRHQVDLVEAKTQGLEELIKNYEQRLQTASDHHKSELSALEVNLAEKFIEEKTTLEEEHRKQLWTTRAQLVISNSLEQDYKELKSDLERLKTEKDINSAYIKRLEDERNAILQNAQESRSRLANIHEEEMSEIRLFFEEKLSKAEEIYTEEITAIKEQYEMELAQTSTPENYQKPYHTGDSMTESLQAKEREKSKVYHTMTVLSDLDSSEGSPPRMTLGEMEESLINDKSQRITELETEIDELTAKIVKAENDLEQQKSLAEKFAKEKDSLETKLKSSEHENMNLAERLDAGATELEHSLAMLRQQHMQEVELEKAAELQRSIEYEERHSAEITRCKLEIANLNGKLVEKEKLLEDALLVAEEKQTELAESLRQQLIDLQAEHERQQNLELGKLRESLQAEHTAAVEEIRQQLENAKRQELAVLEQGYNDTVSALKQQIESIQKEHADKLDQMDTEYKIALDSMQSEKQLVDDNLERITEEYVKQQKALDDGDAPALLLLRQELDLINNQEKAELRRQYEDNIRQLMEQHEEKLSEFQSSSEAALEYLMIEHKQLLGKALEERREEVKAVIEEYEAKAEDTENRRRQQHDEMIEDLRLKLSNEAEVQRSVSADKLKAMESEHRLMMQHNEEQFNLKLEQAQLELKEQLLAEYSSNIDELTEEMKSTSVLSMEEMLETLRQEQADEMMQQQEKHEKEMEEMRQKTDDLDAAHTEELRILANEHDQQLQVLQEQLSLQLEKMSAEIKTLEADHELQLQQEKESRDNLLEGALLEQHDDHERDIARRNEAADSEREAWDAERAAHEAEVQCLEDTLNLERGEYKSKLEDQTGRLRELETQLEQERKQSKEASELWIGNMSQLQTEQERLKQEQQDAVRLIEEKYKGRIETLEAHLQRVVTASQAKDEQIQQLKTDITKLQEQIVGSSNSRDLVSQLQADLDHGKQERDAISMTNQKLLELLSNSVETQRSLESHIFTRIGPVQGFGQDGRSTPVNRPSQHHSRAGGAAGGAAGHPLGGAANYPQGGAVARDDAATPTPHDKSFDSEMADEGLDLSHMSQTREMSLFAGPNLNCSEEETVLESGRHLQEVVEVLLSRIETVNSELAEVRRDQDQLLTVMAERNHRVSELESEVATAAAVEEEIREQMQTLLDQQPHQGESVEELKSQKQVILDELLDTQQKLSALATNYSEAQEQLEILQNEREAMEEMRGHVESQHSTMTSKASEAERPAEDSEHKSAESSELLDSNLALKMENMSMNSQLKSFEDQLEEAVRKHNEEIKILTEEKEDLEHRIESLEKAAAHDKQFIERQMFERDLEQEESTKMKLALDKAEEKLRSQEDLISSLQGQLAEAESDLHQTSENQLTQSQLSISQSEMSRAELNERESTITHLRQVVGSLEEELNNSGVRERSLRTKLDLLQSSSYADQTTYDALPEQQHNMGLVEDLALKLEEALKTVKILRDERDSLGEQVEAVKTQSEDYIQENTTLKSNVYEHLSTISDLRSQLEAGKLNTPKSTQVELLVEQLSVTKEALEKSEDQVVALTEQLNTLETKLAGYDHREDESEIQLQEREAEHRDTVESLNSKCEQLEQIVRELQDKLDVQNQSSQTTSIDELMKQLIVDRDQEIEQLKESLRGQGQTSKSEEAERLAEQVSMLEGQRSVAVQEAERLSKEVETLTAKLERLEESKSEELENLKEELAKLEESDHNAAQENKRLQEQVDSLVERCASKSMDIDSLNEKIMTLEEKCASKSLESDELAVEVAAKTTQMEELQTVVAALKTENKSLEEYSTMLQNETKHIRGIQNELNSDFNQINSMIDEKETVVSSLTASATQLEQENTSLVDEKAALEQQVSTLSREVRELGNIINEKEEEMYMLTEKVEEMEKEKGEVVQLSSQMEQLLLQKNQISENNLELVREVDSLRLRARDAQDQSDKYKSACETLRQQLTDLQTAEEDTASITKSELDAMISEKIELALQLDQAKQETSQLSQDLSVSEAAATKLHEKIDSLTAECDSLSIARNELEALNAQLNATLCSVKQERKSLVLEVNANPQENVSNAIQQENILLQAQITKHLQELERMTEDRNGLLVELSNIRDQVTALREAPESHVDILNRLTSELETKQQLTDDLSTRLQSATEEAQRNSQAVEELLEENRHLMTQVANSHDAKDIDDRLAKLQQELEVQMKEKAEEIQALSAASQDELIAQRDAYEETIATLNAEISEMRGEFAQEYQRLKDQVVGEVTSTLQNTLPDESFSDSVRRDIEAKIAKITNGHHRDSDQDTIPDTSSVVSTIGEDAPIIQQQQHHMNQIERVSGSIYKLSSSGAAYSDQLVESLLHEKEILQASIQSLKDLLSQIDSARAEAAFNDSHPTDWRGALIQATQQTFARDRELYLQELRSFVASRGGQTNEVERLESRLQSLTLRQETNLDHLFSADRQSLLDEIAEHRSLINKMKDETLQFCSQLEKSKAEARRQAELNEAKLAQQTVLTDDMSRSLASEQLRSSGLTQELSSLRDQCLSMESELANSNAELEHVKQLLSTEQQKFASLQNRFSDEQGRTALTEQQLQQQVEERHKLRQHLNVVQNDRKIEREEAQNVAQTLRQDIQLLRDKNSETSAKLDKESLSLQTTKRQLIEEQHAAINRERKVKSQVAQLELTLDMERAKQLELTQQIGLEKRQVEDLRKHVTELETRPPLTEYKQICDELDSEKTRCLDVQSALDRERNRSANLSAALDLARAQALEELEEERKIVNQLKRDLDYKQKDVSDLKAKLDGERNTVAVLRNEISLLQASIETANAASFEAQRRLAQEQTIILREREAVKEIGEINEELQKHLANAEATVAERDCVIAAQKRDLTKMRHHSSRALGVSESASLHSPSSSDQQTATNREINKKLRLLAVRLQDASGSTQRDLVDVFAELNQIDDVMDGNAESSSFANQSEATHLLELVEKLTADKEELRAVLCTLEAEIETHKLREVTNHKTQTPGAVNGRMSKYWFKVVNDLYSRMRRAEARVRGLTYQKKLILLQLGGYEECEAVVLEKLANMGAVNPSTPIKIPPRRRFIAAVRAVIITRRLRWLVARSKKLVTDGVQALINKDKENNSFSDNQHSRKASMHRPESSKYSVLLPTHETGPSSKRCSRRSDSNRTRSTVEKLPDKHVHSARPGSANPVRPSSSSTVYGVDNRRFHAPVRVEPENGPSSQTSKSSSRANSQMSGRSSTASSHSHLPQSQQSQHKSKKPASRISSKTSSREDLRAASYASPPGSPLESLSRRSTPKNSPRESPVPRDGVSPSSLSRSSYNPNRHAQCIPADALLNTASDNRRSHDDSVAENIIRLERLQERLTDMQKPSSPASDPFI